MRKIILTWLVFTNCLLAAPTTSNVSFKYLTYSAVTIKFDSTTYNNVRFGINATGNSCAGGGAGAGGYFQQNVPGSQTVNEELIVGGLIPSTGYHICVQTSNDGGSTWSTGGEVTPTTLATPPLTPVPPRAPRTFNTNYPNTTGYTVLNVPTDCTINTCIATAQTGQCTNGYIIRNADGSSITNTNIEWNQDSCDIGANRKFHPADVNLSTDQITVTGHGFIEGQEVQIGGTYISGTPVAANCTGAVATGQLYTVHFIDTNHIQLYCTDKVTIMDFIAQGTVSNYFSIMDVVRPNLFPIIFGSTSATTPGASFPPEHVRITPQWAPKMATWATPLSNLGTDNFANSLLVVNNHDGGNSFLISKIRFVGLELTTPDSAEAHTTSDPKVWFKLIALFPWNNQIIFDRCWIHGQGTPNRLHANFWFDGNYVALVDSYLNNLTAYHTMNSSVISRTDATHFDIATGIVNSGQGKYTVPHMVGTISGSTSGTAYIWADILNSNAITTSSPTGITWSITGTTVTIGPTATTTGTCAVYDRTNWPLNTSGDPTVTPLGCIIISGGNITSVIQPDVQTSANGITEGCNFMQGGSGPGPWKVENNYIEGAGNIWHHDDTGSNSRYRADYSYTRNYFQLLMKYMYNPTTLASGLADGISMYQRNTLEWKSGDGISLIGNIFDGAFTEAAHPLGAITFTSVAGQGIKNLLMRYNTIKHGGNAIEGPVSVNNGSTPQPPVISSFDFSNNLIYDIFGDKYWSSGEGLSAANGWAFEGPSGGESFNYRHNTIIGIGSGIAPSILWTFGIYQNFTFIRDNFLTIWAAQQGIKQDGGVGGPCSGLFGSVQFNCSFIPVGSTNGVFGNVIQSPDANQAAVQAMWPGGTNVIPVDMDVSHNGFYHYALDDTADFRLTNVSVYNSGGTNHASDHLPMGIVDMTSLLNAQGQVGCCGVGAVTTTTASVSFRAPDTQSCPIFLSTSPWNSTLPSYTSYADSGTSPGKRSVALTSLATHTVYYGMVMCSSFQPTFQFKTN